MTIRNKLLILAFVPIIVLIVIASGSLLVRQQLVDSLRTRDMMDDVTLGVFDLNRLTRDYVQSHLERAEVQWQVRYQSVGDTLSRVQVTSVEAQLVLDRLRSTHEGVGALFSSLVVITREAGVHHEEIAETLASQLFIESQTMVTDCSILANIAGEELLNAQQRAAYIFWPTLILAVLGGLAGSLLIYRSIAKPVRELGEGAEIIGTGNLDYRVGTSAKDEIGALSRAFDQMTENLKVTTVSRDELAVEVVERKQVEAALRETHDYLEKLIQYASAPIIVWNPTSEIIRFNRAFECLTDYAVDEVIGKQLTMLFPEANQAESLRKIAQASAGEYWSSAEIPILTKDGKTTLVLWNSANIYADDATTLLATIAQGVDITERKQAEDDLQKQMYLLTERVKELGCLHAISGLDQQPAITLEEFLQGAVNTIPSGWQYPDIACARITLEDQEFTTDNFTETAWKQRADMAVGGERIGTLEMCYLQERPEADEGPFLKDERNLLNTVAARLGSIIIRRRGRELLRKHSERLEEMVEERIWELRDAQEELVRAERLATLGQFSGSISHELRNPLGVIDSSVYYLKAQLKDADEKVHQHLDRIKLSVASSTAIIQSLLDLTRMKESQLARLDLVRAISDGIATSGVPDTVEVIEDFAGQEIAVNGDGEQLRMALKNIVKNAEEAMGDRGTLTVTVRSNADGRAEVSFADTGVGIPAENLEKVFQPLFSTKAEGIGFGLSIAKMIVDRHGGTIEARSEPGEGATIVIRLPLAENAKAKGKKAKK